MATRNVSTAEEFIRAFKLSQTDDTIEVLADLDWNDIVDDITSTIRLGDSTSSKNNVTINGNNHAFYNMTSGRITGSTATIFSINNSTGFKVVNLSFLNCNMRGRTTYIFFGDTSSEMTITNAVIQGTFKNGMFRGSSTNCIVKNSMVTIDYSDGTPIKPPAGNLKWEYCWFRFSDLCFYTPSGNVAWAQNLNGCYLEGKLEYAISTLNPTLMTSVNNSCINLVIHSVHQPAIDTLIQPGGISGGTQSCNIINIEKINTDDGHELTEENSTTWNKCVTDEHMKNATYLATIGFDIIP